MEALELNVSTEISALETLTGHDVKDQIFKKGRLLQMPDMIEIFGTNIRTVQRWCQSQGLPYSVITPRRRYFIPFKVLKWLEERQVN